MGWEGAAAGGRSPVPLELHRAGVVPSEELPAREGLLREEGRRRGAESIFAGARCREAIAQC